MIRVTFIVGCTAGGKESLGMALAGASGGQIVSVDSMKIYRRMDIGTAKASAAARRAVAHHCIDLVEPSENFSVGRYVEAADAAISAIAAAGATVLAVGGTPLYVKAVSEGLFEGPAADPALRAALKARAAVEGLAALHRELAALDEAAGARIHPNDEKRIIRALEVHALTGKPISELQRQWEAGTGRYDCLFIGIRRSREDASGRINRRVKRMIDQGLRDEVAALLAEPEGLSAQAAQAVGYAEMIDHLQGRCTLDEAIERIKINTRQLAKHQRTWFRRFPVQWIDAEPETPSAAIAERALAILRTNK